MFEDVATIPGDHNDHQHYRERDVCSSERSELPSLTREVRILRLEHTACLENGAEIEKTDSSDYTAWDYSQYNPYVKGSEVFDKLEVD